ncbi:hypothetical protein PM082_013879 [Marasmius tenuissimus]|nr:hypothetical protein PM082_013879 [Marasmius tenuissimus]
MLLKTVDPHQHQEQNDNYERAEVDSRPREIACLNWLRKRIGVLRRKMNEANYSRRQEEIADAQGMGEAFAGDVLQVWILWMEPWGYAFRNWTVVMVVWKKGTMPDDPIYKGNMGKITVGTTKQKDLWKTDANARPRDEKREDSGGGRAQM